jgi:hypothetical protein
MGKRGEGEGRGGCPEQKRQCDAAVSFGHSYTFAKHQAKTIHRKESSVANNNSKKPKRSMCFVLVACFVRSLAAFFPPLSFAHDAQAPSAHPKCSGCLDSTRTSLERLRVCCVRALHLLAFASKRLTTLSPSTATHHTQQRQPATTTNKHVRTRTPHRSRRAREPAAHDDD